MANQLDQDGGDDQDGAEALDEDMLGIETDERKTFEELPDLLDVTSAEGDADDDDALIGEDLDDEEDHRRWGKTSDPGRSGGRRPCGAWRRNRRRRWTVDRSQGAGAAEGRRLSRHSEPGSGTAAR